MYRSQEQLRYAYRLPLNAFDIQSWQVGNNITGIDEVKHYLRYRVPSLNQPGTNGAFIRVGNAKTDKPTPDYELSQQTRDDMNTHDFTQNTWGHSLSNIRPLPDNRASALGFGEGIEEGHFMVFRTPTGTTRYKVDKVEYRRDPHDMWSAELSFAPRPR